MGEPSAFTAFFVRFNRSSSAAASRVTAALSTALLPVPVFLLRRLLKKLANIPSLLAVLQESSFRVDPGVGEPEAPGDARGEGVPLETPGDERSGVSDPQPGAGCFAS